MSVEYADDGLHRQVHHGFVERKEVLAELDHLLLHDGIDHCVFLTGGLGMGKSAIAANWLARSEAAHELVVHHILRRQQSDKAEPWVIGRSLTSQIEKLFPHIRDPFARPEACLSGILSRVSRELTSHGRRMVLVIDELDKRGSGGDHREVLACLPRPLPGGIRLLLSGGSYDQLRDLEGRYGRMVAVDLDDPRFAADNEATVRAFWLREAPALALDQRFVERAIRSAAGNMLHATLLRRHLASVPRSQHRPEEIPRDLPSLLAMVLQRVDADQAAVRALEILCAARGPLSLDQIGRVAGWSDLGDMRAVVNSARQLIVESQRGDRVTVIGLFHEAVRSFLIERLGPIAIRGLHRALADKLATWPAPRDPASRRYALRYAVGHRIATGDCQAIQALATNVDFLEAKCREFGLDDVELNVRHAAEACLAGGQFTLHGDLDRLARSIARESSSLPRDAGVDAAQLWCRVRQVLPSGHVESPVPSRAGGGMQPGGSIGSLPARPALLPALTGRDVAVTPVAVASSAAGGTASVVARSMAMPGRPALLRDLTGGGGAVTACAVTPDSRRVVAAYSDHSLKVWDIESGRLLKTFTGHSGVIESCAVTPDGRVISASADTTLKVWDLTTGYLLATLEGHTDSVEGCAVTPDGRVISASADATLKVWDLTTGYLLATLEGHRGSVESCVVTPDGRVISASADTTLKVWDLTSGNVLATFKGHTDTVASCSVTADGRYVISGSGDYTLKVWDVGTGSVTSTLKGHAGPVTSCAVASDRRSVYSASSDTTLKIWDVDTGRMVTTLESHTGPVTCCAVTPDGRRLISGSSDDTLKVWALDGSRTSTLPGGAGPLPVVTLPTPADRSLLQRPRKPSGTKQLILFLAANPQEYNRQVLEQECAAIESELRQTRHGNDFEFLSKWALTVDDMARHLLDLDPTIVHFRGQGRKDTSGYESGTSCDAPPHGDSGIYLHDERHEVQLVTGRALKMMVENSAPSARIVVLNACYSDGHAAELCQVVECVVGMTRDHDHAARSFAVAFYRALGHRRSVGNAIAHARATLAAKQLPDECVPRCRTLNWVDPHEISLSPEHLAP